MAIIEAEPVAFVRQPLRTDLVGPLERANLRAFPALQEVEDAGWVTRLSPGNPSKRINSLNFLEGAAHTGMETRLDAVHARFADAGLAPLVRWTPLLPEPVDRLLDARGWERFEETLVLTGDVASAADASLNDGAQGPAVTERSLGEWIAAFGAVGGTRPQTAEAQALRTLQAALERSRATLLPLVAGEAEGPPMAVLLGVVDGPFVGIFDVATAAPYRRQGLGTRLIGAALARARAAGATTAWLQVGGANAGARSLYRGLGFGEAYRYHYRRPAPEAGQPGVSPT